jgi:hypothetical protein
MIKLVRSSQAKFHQNLIKVKESKHAAVTNYEMETIMVKYHKFGTFKIF